MLSPSAIPRVTDVARACAFPELAVLSAAAHGRSEQGQAIGEAAIAACDELDNPLATLYSDYVLESLDEAARHALEALMAIRKYEFKNKYIRRYVAMGHQEAQRKVLLEQLVQRFGKLPEETRQRIEQAEMTELERWIERVIPAATLADVFADN